MRFVAMRAVRKNRYYVGDGECDVQDTRWKRAAGCGLVWTRADWSGPEKGLGTSVRSDGSMAKFDADWGWSWAWYCAMARA